MKESIDILRFDNVAFKRGDGKGKSRLRHRSTAIYGRNYVDSGNCGLKLNNDNNRCHSIILLMEKARQQSVVAES